MAESVLATLRTSLGDIVILLYPDKAPKTVENFTGLAEGTRAWTHPATGEPADGPLYPGTLFHRVVPGFMIQGGDPLGTGTGGPGYAFPDEIHPALRFNRPYLVAMANSGRNTNGSQFFITTSVGAAQHLTGRHTIFGKVIEGTGVVDRIAALPADADGRPEQDVTIESVTIERRRS
ncbi:peptidylprolyl isomerase [Actinomadura parmotrematis]|uniref:Peptidyl-prolyl cis-trans isomerase n=1 Tax=Actinomadura parmotrematis TaxID=2864039 RepID=A0ABS7FQH7_9ACTN|nr:peptidylprolyl isomerase [Actinomadura parmotrematis]MBW8481812.1 peptidylprolyl isomerase [Actinomadura parmotrematis]